MKTDVTKRKLVALPPEAIVLMVRVQNAIEKRLGARVGDGQIMRMALLALAKQEGVK